MHDNSQIEGALFDISARLDILSESERKVSEYVLAEPKKSLHFNVRELAKQSGTSQAAVVRFCKSNGFESFSNFKLRLARDVFRDYDERYIPDLNLESEPSPDRVIQAVIDKTQRALSTIKSVLDPSEVERAANTIFAAESTLLLGVGASGVVAYDFMQKLVRLGRPVFYTHDTDLQLTAASTIRPTDVAFVISYSGENSTMIEAVKQISKKKVPIISLTMDNKNTIRSFARTELLVPVSERIYRQGAATSRINQLVVIDMLYSIMVSKNIDASINAIEQTMAATHRNSAPES